MVGATSTWRNGLKFQIPIRYFNPFRHVEVAPTISREELSRCAHFFGEVVGLGLRKLTVCPLEVNLLPGSVRVRNQMKQKRPYFAGAALCLLLVPLCWLAYTKKVASLKDQQLSDVRLQVETLQGLDGRVKKEQAQLGELKDKTDQIVSLVQQRSLWPEFLQDLNSRLASNLWIAALTPQSEEGTATGAARPGIGRPMRPQFAQTPGAAEAKQPPITQILIDGGGNHSADDLLQAGQFANNLRESPFFDKTGVEIISPPNPMEKGSTFTFSIMAKLAKPITF